MELSLVNKLKQLPVKGSGNTRTLVISGAEMASVATNNYNYTTAEKGLLWIGIHC